MGVKPSCVRQRDGVSDREDNLRKTERGHAVGVHGGLQASNILDWALPKP